MQKTKIFILIILTFFAAPGAVMALGIVQVQGLQMPQSGNDLAAMFGINAQAYVVTDAVTGRVLIDKNSGQGWVPASLTKLVTALVVLDTKPKLSKTVAMATADQVAGGCSQGGACIKTKPGVKFTVDGLFHALLMPSANNAASALARSTGLSTAAFVAKMNQKAAALGAINTHFNEPTGMDPSNSITAADYAKIVTAAFSNPYLQAIAQLDSYPLRSANNSRYNQTIKNTDKLLGDADIQILGAKTGYLNESKYNFAAVIKTFFGQQYAVVVLGEQHLSSAFDETKELAGLAGQAEVLAMLQTFQPQVLGTTTQQTSTSLQLTISNQ